MSSANSSLRPAWRNQSAGGRGFQPPPSVASERDRSQSMGSAGENSGSGGGTYNKFSALDDDDEGLESGGGPPSIVVPKGNSRSEALRQGLGPRNASLGTKPLGGGRRLADLAAQSPTPERPAGRFTGRTAAPPAAPSLDEGKIIRFTRENLLSMRPAPSNKLPDVLKPLEGNVILAEEPQDPVCWDTFDAEEIWATVPRRPVKPVVAGRSLADMAGETPVLPARARRDGGSSAGRWQRGVALPPPSAADGKPRKERDTDNPDDLWDDPVSGAAAGDFSAFADLGKDEEEDTLPTAAFDFEKMAEESRLLEEELHGGGANRSRAGSEATDQESAGSQIDDGGNLIPAVKKVIDPHRPLATVGTTIRSGSGDDVNVFEDFDEPMSSDSAPTAVDPMSDPNLAKEEPVDHVHTMLHSNPDSQMDATSRLMAMIGVPGPAKGDTMLDIDVKSDPVLNPEPQTLSSAWGVPPSPSHNKGIDGISIPLNPWGGPLLPATGLLTGGSLLQSVPSEPVKGLDLQARLREADLEQKAREEEMARRRLEQLEAQKRAAELQQHQQAAAARQQQQQAAAARQQQQAGVQNQVELVLMERISNILENSWGRSDLVSILTTLHAEDSRVIALLNSIEALRALIMRHSSRVQLRHDPSFGADMAILVLTNSQWQQAQQQAQQEALLRARRQEEEMRRREQQRLEEERAAAAAALQNQSKPIIPGAPWYYSDPQQNIQGPFRAEEMRQWFEAGYFKGDLPISQDSNGPFNPLQKIYPDLSVAFMTPDMSQQIDAAEEEEERRRQEDYELEKQRIAEARAAREVEELRAREIAEAEQREREAREAEERERMEMAAQAEAEAYDSSDSPEQTNGGNESSAQLKMMLGLSGQMQQHSSVNDESQRDDSAPRRKSNKKNTPVSKAPQSQAPSVVPEVQPKPAASAWGAPVAAKISARSMSEIQQEEARLATIQSMQRERTAPASSGSSGWANVAAASKTPQPTGWSASAPKITPGIVAAPKPGQAIPKPTQARKQSTGDNRAQVANVASSNPQGHPSGKQSGVGGNQTVADEFGAKMSPALEKWGKEQMMKLNGTEDLTLLAFCMTLKDPNEIRQYLIAYLGSSPQVNNFANEFIARKVGAKPTKQEEWETTVPGKKKGKKKVSGR